MRTFLLTAAFIVSVAVGATAQTKKEAVQASSTEHSQQFRPTDFTQIQTSDVPSLLRTTLEAEAYKGWENGKIYLRKDGGVYWLTTASKTGVKNYYFDSRGHVISNEAVTSAVPGGATNTNQDAKIGTPTAGETYQDKSKH